MKFNAFLKMTVKLQRNSYKIETISMHRLTAGSETIVRFVLLFQKLCSELSIFLHLINDFLAPMSLIFLFIALFKFIK